MALSKKPVTGMKDILPQEMVIRDYVMGVIKETYGKFGFTPIETPCVENISNLSNKQGGENEKLIFKILKRGEKLNLETAQTEADLVDGGLRYDLTVPLVRFYSNNANNLPSPFKALQMGNVWRADRPQRGRYRQFMQCDIDILGEPSNLAEIELILATTTTLSKLEFKNFQIRINDRQILKAMAAYSGFPEDAYDSVFITLDKMDKIGLEGVEKELLENGFAAESVTKYLNLFKGIETSDNGLAFLPKYINAMISLQVEQYIDLDTHGMFICSITEARVLSDKETMTYAYYLANVKPKPEVEGKKGYVCNVCGYVYEGDVLPDDIVCPLCKHGASDFEKIK